MKRLVTYNTKEYLIIRKFIHDCPREEWVKISGLVREVSKIKWVIDCIKEMIDHNDYPDNVDYIVFSNDYMKFKINEKWD